MRRTLQPGESTTGPRLWVVLARAHRAMAAYIEECVASEGLCLSDFMVLEVLLHKGPMPISAIGERVLLANASMTAAVDRLAGRTFVSRKQSDRDRRSRIVALTPEGIEFVSRVYAQHERDIEEVTSALDEGERDQLRLLLKKIGFAAQVALGKKHVQAAGAKGGPLKDTKL